jgi:hypothetical protein
MEFIFYQESLFFPQNLHIFSNLNTLTPCKEIVPKNKTLQLTNLDMIKNKTLGNIGSDRNFIKFCCCIHQYFCHELTARKYTEPMASLHTSSI